MTGRAGWSSRAAARRADLFFEDLVGEQSPAPARAAGSCARDVAVTNTLALLHTTNAPLPVTPAEASRAARVPGAVDDYKAVAAIVPATAEPRLLIFLHGNNNYVTVAPSGDVPASVDPSGHSRVPRWTDARARAAASRKPAVELIPGLDSLAASQRSLQPAYLLTDHAVKDPVVLVPEDAELRTSAGPWAVPPPGQYGTPRRLQELVMECYDHLRCLQNPSGRAYLPPQMVHRASWLGNVQRIYVSGHSGGGLPLVEAAGADMVLITPSSVAGVGGRAVEFWLFDCTYGWGIHNYVNFCVNWNNARLLAHRRDAARLVCVYWRGTRTEIEADALRKGIADALRVPAATLRVLHDSTDMTSRSMVDDVIPALTSRPVVFIRTDVPHGEIPIRFAPLLLRTAAS